MAAIILFDGRDAAGKGGTIRRVTRSLDFKLNPDIVIPGDPELKIMEKQLARKGAFKE
jgi:polyphosphate kinase 2 (PPK2 family)